MALINSFPSGAGGGGAVFCYVVGQTPFASDWLSLEASGTPLTPNSKRLYLIISDDEFYNLFVRWDATNNVYVPTGEKALNITKTLLASAWDSQNHQTLQFEGFNTSMGGVIGMPSNLTNNQKDAYTSSIISVSALAGDRITFHCKSVPTINLPVTLYAGGSGGSGGGSTGGGIIYGFYDSVTDRFYVESQFETVIEPEADKLWIDVVSNKSYRWDESETEYIRVDEVALGETSTTAYRGDRGKIAYDFSQTPETSAPLENGTASVGVSNKWSRGDHVHPHDGTKADSSVIAPEFKSSVQYVVGKSVYYNGEVYIFTNDHLGEWNAADVEKKVITDLLPEPLSALEVQEVKDSFVVSGTSGGFPVLFDERGTEYQVGWYVLSDGTKKPVYRKTLLIASFPNNAEVPYPHGISNIDKIVAYGAMIRYADGSVNKVPYVADNPYIAGVYVTKTNVNIKTYTNRSAVSGEAYIMYTLTTDTPI